MSSDQLQAKYQIGMIYFRQRNFTIKRYELIGEIHHELKDFDRVKPTSDPSYDKKGKNKAIQICISNCLDVKLIS